MWLMIFTRLAALVKLILSICFCIYGRNIHGRRLESMQLLVLLVLQVAVVFMRGEYGLVIGGESGFMLVNLV